VKVYLRIFIELLFQRVYIIYVLFVFIRIRKREVHSFVFFKKKEKAEYEILGRTLL